MKSQIDYLTKRYGAQVPDGTIALAVHIEPAFAERLLYGITTNVISTDALKNPLKAVEAVRLLDPFKKESNKTKADHEYAALVRKAKSISVPYWQWIIGAWKDGIAEVDADIIDYFLYNNIPCSDVLGKSYKRLKTLSDTWHSQQSVTTSETQYTFGIDSPGAIKLNDLYYLVPVPKSDAKAEGTRMQNCIGRSCIPAEDNVIYSVRDKFNGPHVSLQITKGYREELHLAQIKGKQNKLPSTQYADAAFLAAQQMLEKHKAPIGRYSDFWDLLQQHPEQVNSFILRAMDPVDTLVTKSWLIPHIDQSTVDKIVKHGVGLERLPANILKTASAGAAQIALSKKIGASAVLRIVQYCDITESVVRKSLSTTDLGKHGKMVIAARFRPAEFLEEMKKLDTDDLRSMINDYAPAIIAYDGQIPGLGHALIGAEVRDQAGDEKRLYSMIPKIPDGELLLVWIKFLEKNPTATGIFTCCNLVLPRLTDDLRASTLKVLFVAHKTINSPPYGKIFRLFTVTELTRMYKILDQQRYTTDDNWVANTLADYINALCNPVVSSNLQDAIEEAETIPDLKALLFKADKVGQKHIQSRINRLLSLESTCNY